ncbi:MAG: HEAT repeat domain-containing protein, partial [Planctomycetes bacterium]|nr:HEAT repeat domain-containing protein [Planctomycetota bacterium]
PKSLKDLKEELKHFDYKVRLAAVDRIRALATPEAAQALLPVLEDGDWEVRIRALAALGALKAPETVEALARQAVEGEILLVREAAVAALRALDQPDTARRLLKGAGKAKDEMVKVHAIEAAGALARESDFDAFVPYLLDRETKVRAAAARALGKIAYLLKVLREKEVRVQAGVIEALGEIGGPEALGGLRDALLAAEDPYFFERITRALRAMDPAVSVAWLGEQVAAEKKADRRARFARVLAHLGHPAAGAPLAALLADPDAVVRAWAAKGVGLTAHAEGAERLAALVEGDPDATVRRVALESLAWLAKDKAARVAALVKALGNTVPEIRIRACVLLARDGSIEAIPALAKLADAADWFESTAALIAIGRLGHVGEVEIVAKRRADPDWRVRAAVLEALGQLRHMDVVPYLIEGLTDRDPIAASAALKNLQILSQSSKGPDVEEWKRWYEENKGKLDITKKGFHEEVPDDYYAKTKYLIEILNKAQIVCVLGKYDHAETVLEHLSIRTTVIRPQEILTIGLNPKQLLLINCEGSIGRKEAIDALQWFVHVGGFLMTTDWALQNAVVRAFPGYIDREESAKTGNDVVEIEAADPAHPLLRGVFDKTTRLMWWLEVIAYPMKVIDPFRTDILVDSLQMLERRYGSSTLATVFDYGHGKVEHCVSHFYLQEEGLTSRTTAKDRKIFAADHLGLSLDQIRTLEARGFFDGAITEAMTKEIAEDYSMFKLIVNFVVEKRRQVEQD